MKARPHPPVIVLQSPHEDEEALVTAWAGSLDRLAAETATTTAQVAAWLTGGDIDADARVRLEKAKRAGELRR